MEIKSVTHFELLVPSCRHEYAVLSTPIWHVDVCDTLDWRIMARDLLILSRRDIVHLHSIVATRRKEVLATLDIHRQLENIDTREKISRCLRPTLDQTKSSTGAWCEYIALGSDWPCELTLYMRT